MKGSPAAGAFPSLLSGIVLLAVTVTMVVVTDAWPQPYETWKNFLGGLMAFAGTLQVVWFWILLVTPDDDGEHPEEREESEDH